MHVPNRPSRLVEAGVLLCLLAFFFYIASFVIGIGLWDDTEILRFGTLVHRNWFVHQQDTAPLYSYWFRLLSLFCPNPIHRFFLSWGLLVTLIAGVPLLMKVHGAWAYTFILLVFPFLTINPYVSLFAGVILLFGLCALLRTERRISGALATACGVCFIVSFCRPEYNYGVFLSAAATIPVLFFERSRAVGEDAMQLDPARIGQRPGQNRLIAVAKAVMVICLASATLYVMQHSSNTRSGVAFAQHFNLRAQEHGELKAGEFPWVSEHAGRAFGVDQRNGPASLGAFMRANPRLFLRHVLRNLLDPRTLIFLVVLSTVILWPWLRGEARALRPASIYVGCISVCPLMGMLLIYPRDHYAIMLVPSLTILAVQEIRPERWMNVSIAWLLPPAFGLIWFLNLGYHVLPRSPFPFERSDLRRVQCVRQIDGLAISASQDVFDTAFINEIYLVHPRIVTRPQAIPDWTPFRLWVKKVRPAWISTDPSLAAQYNITPAQLDLSLKDMGYVPHPCPANARELTVYTDEAVRP